MNETVLVEFCALNNEAFNLSIELNSLDPKIEYIKVNHDGNYTIITSKITSEQATLIKLQNKFLSERMRISYIPNELKDRYRK